MNQSDMEDLYQDIILEHNRHPHNFHALKPARRATGHNPMCGDEIEVFARIENGRITDLSFQGQGCAISRASASLMTDALKGRTVAEADAAIERVRKMVTDAGFEVSFTKDGDLAALSGVRRFPARVKCATLAWHALHAALHGEEQVTTES